MRAAFTTVFPIVVSDCIWAGSQKLVTAKAPWAPSKTGCRLPTSRRSPRTRSTPRLASTFAASLAGLRTATRTWNRPCFRSASTTPPPCAPVPPSTAITRDPIYSSFAPLGLETARTGAAIGSTVERPKTIRPTYVQHHVLLERRHAAAAPGSTADGATAWRCRRRALLLGRRAPMSPSAEIERRLSSRGADRIGKLRVLHRPRDDHRPHADP